MEDLLTFKIGKYGIEYLTELPSYYIKMPDLWQLFIMIDPGKGKVNGNMKIRNNITLLIYDPYVKEYYPRYIGDNSDKEALYKYFKDGNLYINKDDLL